MTTKTILSRTLLVLLPLLILSSCLYQGPSAPQGPLPILGERDFVDGDTIYHQIPDFEFMDQDSQVITNATFADKLYIVDFFFVSCPTICPIVSKSMLRIHDEFKNEGDLLLLAHTIDVKHDTIPRLKKYAEGLGVSSDKWHFVTGDKEAIYGIADDYFSVAVEDPDVEGGFDHSGRLILIDQNRHVRSFCDGTDPESVDRFIEDVRLLLGELHATGSAQ
ncbi:MAG: SCO family protein [Phaeodactylibacter sp.]|nr:SCO family protein [Phaeodactylibacter sp.]